MVTLQLPAPVSPAAVTYSPDPASFAVRETTPAEPPKPRLLDRVRAALRARHYSRRTEEAYVAWIKRYIFFFHAYTHVLNLGPAAVRSPADRMFSP
jgi:hypothetical protein